MKKNKKEAGKFSLTFERNPLKFSKMEVKNDMDQTITVSFMESVFGKKLSSNLFVIKDDRLPQ